MTEKEQLVEIAKCMADVAYFTHEFLTIDDSQGHGGGGGSMPFRLWAAQFETLWDFLSNRLILILKARQLGISWLCCSYALWLCLFQPGKVALLFSKGQNEANELLRRVRVLYERLPEWFKEKSPKLVKSNTTTLEWDNGSRIISLPATQSAGRGMTASLVILDEAAFLKWGTELYTALKPTIDAGGQLIILSTANGLGNLFHRLWIRAAKGLSDFKTIFLPWHARPGRTWAWFLKLIADADDPDLVPQEYPATATEAFVSSGRTRFNAKWIRRLARRREAIAPTLLDESAWPTHIQGNAALSSFLRLYALPVPGRRYVLAADPAEGKEGKSGQKAGDYSAATLIEVQSDGRLREVGCVHGHIEPGEFGLALVALAEAYNAELIVERNNHGHAVLLSIGLSNEGAGYPWLLAGPDGGAGWLSNAATKPLAVNILAECLRDDALDVLSSASIDEMQIYAVLKNGSTGAPKGDHDDLVTTWALACTIARFPPSRGDVAQIEDTTDANAGLFSGY